MKRSIKSVVVAIFLTATLLASASAAPAETAKVPGDWNLTVAWENVAARPRSVTFKQDGETLTGTYNGPFGEGPLQGTIKGNEIEFTVSVNTPNGSLTLNYSGTVDGDTMKGTVKVGEKGEGSFTGKKKTAESVK